MTPFNSLVVLKRPRQELWNIMRDHLTALIGSLDDIERVEQIERQDDNDGVVHIVNRWRAYQHPAVRSILQIDELIWLDRNRWDSRNWTCTWIIEPAFLSDQITCSGQTSFAEAMGGQGTRVIVTGEFDLKPEALVSVQPIAAGLIESAVGSIIPRNLRAIAEAAASFALPCP